MKIQKNHKLVLAVVGAVTLLLVGISFSLNAAVLEGRLKSVKSNPSMEAEDNREFKPTKDGMEAESTDELKPTLGMEAESTDE